MLLQSITSRYLFELFVLLICEQSFFTIFFLVIIYKYTNSIGQCHWQFIENVHLAVFIIIIIANILSG